MKNFKDKFWFLIEPLKQIAYGMAIYVCFSFFYANHVQAAQCVTQTTVWAFNASTGTTRTSYQVPVMAGVNLPNNFGCGYLILTGSEYQSLITNTTTATNTANTANTNATTANTNATTANTNATNALNVANGAQASSNNTNQYLQNTLIPAVNTATTTANDALTLANQANNNLPTNNPDNILNISPADASTLMYALLGLLVVAFVGRQLRKSVSIADTNSID